MTAFPLRLSLPLLWLAACVPTAPDDARYLGPPAVADLRSCGGDTVAALIGGPVSALPATGGWGTLRIIRPGMAVTEDYSASRLDVTLDAADRITALSCG